MAQSILLKNISLLCMFLHVEIQRKLEQEQQLRKTAEEKLLEVEKAKSTVSFDYKQVQQQLQSLQSDLRNETEKVGNSEKCKEHTKYTKTSFLVILAALQ